MHTRLHNSISSDIISADYAWKIQVIPYNVVFASFLLALYLRTKSWCLNLQAWSSCGKLTMIVVVFVTVPGYVYVIVQTPLGRFKQKRGDICFGWSASLFPHLPFTVYTLRTWISSDHQTTCLFYSTRGSQLKNACVFVCVCVCL
jgi:hypothetical protein